MYVHTHGDRNALTYEIKRMSGHIWKMHMCSDMSINSCVKTAPVDEYGVLVIFG